MVKQFSDKEQSESPILSTPTLPRRSFSEGGLPRTRSSTVERFVYIEDVGGSNPSGSTRVCYYNRMEDPLYLNWLHSSSKIRCLKTNPGDSEMEYFIRGENPRLLISSGMHGDEYGVISSVSRAIKIHIDTLPCFIYIPVVNHFGVLNRQRGNASGLDINRGFKNSSMIEESIRLMKLLAAYSLDLSVSFHEDPEFSEFYMYDFASDTDIYDISPHLERFKLKLEEMGTPLFNGIDDVQDPHLGNMFTDGYKIFKKENLKKDTGQLEEWLLEHNLSKRVFNPEIPLTLTQGQKDIIVDSFFKDLIIPYL